MIQDQYDYDNHVGILDAWNNDIERIKRFLKDQGWSEPEQKDFLGPYQAFADALSGELREYQSRNNVETCRTKES